MLNWSKVAIKTLLCYKRLLFQINAVLFNSVHQWILKRHSLHKKHVFSYYYICYSNVSNVSWAANQHIKIISEGSYDTEDCWNAEIPARSHGNSYIFYEVANSYEFLWPHSYKFIQFLLNRTYFTSCTIRMNLYEWPTPNPAPKPTRHWGVDKSYKIVRVRLYEFVRISYLIKYVRIGREIALENSALHQGINYILKYIELENRYFKL